MVCKNYVNGVSRERRILKALENQGFEICFRSAGSHSPIDLVAIDIKNKRINLIQAKPKSLSNNQKRKIELENNKLNDEFIVRFFCLSTLKELDLK